jgi:hypothetical protein
MTGFQNDQPQGEVLRTGASRGAPPAPTGRPLAKASEAKAMLATLRMTAAVGAVGLTLAGWGMLARASSIAPAEVQNNTASFSGSAAGLVAAAQASATTAVLPATNTAVGNVDTASTATETATETGRATEAGAQAVLVLPTATPAPVATATPAPQVQVNVVEWVATRAGDPVAVVQDTAGVLWYVWGPDVTRIEQGLEPEYAPQAVNAVARSRAS